MCIEVLGLDTSDRMLESGKVLHPLWVDTGQFSKYCTLALTSTCHLIVFHRSIQQVHP